MNNNKNGFTLVELLAVIVILAIILVIAVPQIMNVIKDTTKASLESSAKMVAAQVENQYTVAQTLGKEFGDTGSCMEDWAGLNDVDYASCRYEITNDGEARVTIKGSGKFKDLSVCNATRSSATASNEACPLSGIETISALCTDNETCAANNLAIDSGGSIRYYGSNPNNYIEFNDEVWRIIGVIEVKSSSDGNKEKRIKIVRNEALEDYQYATSDAIGDDFYEYLNNNYYNSLTSTAKSQIKITNLRNVIATMESGFSINEYYNDNYDWPSNYIVSIIDVIDYGIAGKNNNEYCYDMLEESICGASNWLNKNTKYWISTYYSDMLSYYWGAMYIKNDGGMSLGGALGAISSDEKFEVFPTVYLKSNVKLTGTGENTSEGIYKIL